MLIVGAAAAIALSARDDDSAPADDSRAATVSQDNTSSPDSSGTAAPDSAPLVHSSEIVLPGSDSGSGGSNRASNAPSGASPAPDPLDSTTEHDRYLHDTRDAVETNTADLASVAEAVITALSGGDAAKLASLVWADEGNQGGYVGTLATVYPPILDSALVPTVNVYATGATTIYVVFCDVTWKDAGLVSQHTIAIPLRLVNGTWYLTSYFENAAALEFVQSVSL